ncbi:MAG: nitroreductase/quinone reductase family protein [Novosphingobium sp.]
MSDETQAMLAEGRKDWIAEHREMYLSSGGAQGHIMDITAVGGKSFATHCMIKYVGRKSGKVFITPLCYGDIGGEVVIVASKGGADKNPEWFNNIVAAETVDFQVATEAFRGTWRVPEGEEHDRIYAFMTENFPFYADYQASTERKIPLLMITAVERIPVFKEEDATGHRQY